MCPGKNGTGGFKSGLQSRSYNDGCPGLELGNLLLCSVVTGSLAWKALWFTDTRSCGLLLARSVFDARSNRTLS